MLVMIFKTKSFYTL